MIRLFASIALLVITGLAWAGSGAPPGPATAPPSARDALWRMIFARPAATASETPVMVARVALGRDLFLDVRLSGGLDRSCASCHDPAQGFSNSKARGAGRDGKDLRRNVPGLFNLAWGRAFYWDGRAPTLEAQARFPIVAENEMAGDFGAIAARLEADDATRVHFTRAFPEQPAITQDTILAALAAYERTLVSPPTRFDHWVAGDNDALSPEEKQGFDIFVGRGGCVACHGGWRFTDDGFHDIGLRSDDPGRGAVTGGVPGLAQFKTPGLRELRATAPYMHDGSLATLRDVVDHYAGNLDKRPSLAAGVRRDLVLDEAEKKALVAFLLTLSADAAHDAGEPRGAVDRAPHSQK